MARKHSTYSIGPGTFVGLSRQESLDALLAGFEMLSAVSRFTSAPKLSGRANLRYELLTTAEMIDKRGKDVLGSAHSNGLIWLNKERNFPNKHATIAALNAHEVAHVFRVPHSSDITSMFHPSLPVRVLNADDIAWCQKTWGMPPDPDAGKITTEAEAWFANELIKFEVAAKAYARVKARKQNKRVDKKKMAQAARNQRGKFFKG